MGIYSSIAKFCVVLGLVCLCHQSNGYKTINEICSPSLNNPTDPRNCDSQQYLVCSNTRTCTCIQHMIWQKDLEKCTFQLNSVCTDQFGGPSWPSQPGGEHGGNGPSPGCPANAYCDASGTKKCRCEDGYEPNEEYTECSGTIAFVNLITMSFSLIISYFAATKLLL